jgi:L-aspartate oxidase
LLEGLVFGARAGRAAARDCTGARVQSTTNVESEEASAREDAARANAAALAVRKRVLRLMWERVGILRSRASLQRALAEFEQIARAPLRPAPRNFLTVATLIARSALWREESRGGHFRVDFPARDDEHWRAHSVIQKDSGLTSSETIDFTTAVSP